MPAATQQPDKRKLKIIIITLLLLALGITLLAYLNRPLNTGELGTVTIKSGDQEIAVITMKDIAALPAVEKTVTINSASEGKSTAVWTGVSIKEILNSVDPQLLAEAKQVLVRAEDGFTSALTTTEIMTGGDDVLLAYKENGQLLKGKTEGGVGPFRLILANDPFGNRMTKYVNELELR